MADDNDLQRRIDESITRLLIKEKRRDTYWRNIRSVVWFLVLAAFFVVQIQVIATGKLPEYLRFGNAVGKPYAAIVRIAGVIESGGNRSAEVLGDAIEKAFEARGSKGVILAVNSPGGSAAQSMLLHDKIASLDDVLDELGVERVVDLTPQTLFGGLRGMLGSVLSDMNTANNGTSSSRKRSPRRCFSCSWRRGRMRTSVDNRPPASSAAKKVSAWRG